MFRGSLGLFVFRLYSDNFSSYPSKLLLEKNLKQVSISSLIFTLDYNFLFSSRKVINLWEVLDSESKISE